MPRSASTRTNRQWCPWCKQYRDKRRFDKHLDSCEQTFLAELERNSNKRKRRRNNAIEPGLGAAFAGDSSLHARFNNIVDIASRNLETDGNMDNHFEPHTHGNHSPNNFISNDGTFAAPLDTQLFIRVEHHPTSGITAPSIIPLDSYDTSIAVSDPSNNCQQNSTMGEQNTASNSFAPFRTLADFEFAELAISSRMPKSTVDGLLKGLDNWMPGGKRQITFRNHRDLMETMTKAREYVVKFREGSVSADFDGETFTFTFRYRDPWEWMVDLVTDPTLASEISYHPVRKYLHSYSGCTRMYDQPNTGRIWWNIASRLPSASGHQQHCFLPLTIWLDKGLVTKRVKLHPIVLRAAFLPSQIRNASGNGGGVIIGYMPIPVDPANPSDRSSRERNEWQCFKREVYHKVLHVILRSLRLPATFGCIITCGDGIERVIFPGIPIASLDGEEACVYCGCRAALANYPCPRCVVHHDELNRLSLEAPLRTTSSMQSVFKQAQSLGQSQRENLLASYGLNFVHNSLWDIPSSDPYAAYSYDTLHSDDLGKWGKHLWPLTLDALEKAGLKGRLAANVRAVPRWADLKHHLNVTTVDYTDGQAFLDILKVILPCLVQLFPPNSALVNCIRSYAQCRMLIGLSCVTEDQITRFKTYMCRYEEFCRAVSHQYRKDFKFYKQHALAHVPSDIRDKGSTHNYSTRPNEGMIQEVREAYNETNKKNVNSQMCRIDENHEAIAQIRMNINNMATLMSDLQQNATSVQETERGDEEAQPHAEEVEGQDNLSIANHVALRSRGDPPVPPSVIQERHKGKRVYVNFDSRIRQFLTDELNLPVNNNTLLKIQEFHTVEIKYQSLENYKTGRDLLRCNPSFFGRERRDCVLINTSDSSAITVARMYGLFDCRWTSLGGTRESCKIALVSMFEPTRWRPATLWDRCAVRQQRRDSRFVVVETFVRGVHMIPVFDSGKDDLFVLNDLIDSDWYLRAGN